MNKTQQRMMALSAMTKRDLLKQANERGIQKEDVINFIQDGEEYTLLYYTDK